MKNRPTKLTFVIKVISGLQLLAYGWTLVIAYSAAHDNNPSDMDWLAVVVPATIFVGLGIVNLILVIIHLVICINQRRKPDYLVLGLAALLIILYFL